MMRYLFAFLFLISTTFAGEAVAKFPIPAEPELTAPNDLIVEVFGDQIKAAKTADAKSELAMTFLTTATSTNDRFEKYALFQQAQDLAAEANDLQLYFQILKATGETFQIDEAKLWSDQLAKLMDMPADNAIVRQLAESDFAAINDPDKRCTAADAWYDIAQTASGPAAKIARDRAVFHYRAAMPGLKGLAKLRSQKRMQDCQKETLTSTTSSTPNSKTESESKTARYGHGRIIEIDCTKGLTAREAQKAQRNAARAYGAPVEITNKLGMRFRFIPAGTFLMGSPENEPHRKKNETRRVVKIAEPFYMAMTEVTQEQYWKVTGQKPSKQKDKPNHPVEQINWRDANDFCLKLSKLDEKRTYQLPTAAQFEYASRAGVLGATYGPLDKIAWHARNSHAKTRAVGLLAPNAWELYDTMGNVWEWCQDQVGSNPNEKVSKGLSVNFWPADHRLAINSTSWAPNGYFDSGFRVCTQVDAK